MIGFVRGDANYPVVEQFLEPNQVAQYTKMTLAKAFALYFKQNWLPILFNQVHTIEKGDEIVYCRDVLVFTPTSKIILSICRELDYIIKSRKIPVFSVVKGVSFSNVQEWRNANRNKDRILIVCYGRDFSAAANVLLLNSMEQDPECRKNEVKIILSTPVIETGKTIDTLSLCIDIGLEQTTSANPFIEHYLTQNDLVLTYVSKNQTTQRLGRVGRKTAGTFVHFYAEDIYERDFQEKEINTYINNK
jgi:HrpA-like RNA helicase